MSWQRGQDGLLSPEEVLHRAAERLAHHFTGMVGEETVEGVVFESCTALARSASVSTHLASVAEKFARDRLTALAQSRGLIAKPVPEILYVCVQNSGRSQMAAAITRHLAGNRVHVRSAGSQPAAGLLPGVVTVWVTGGGFGPEGGVIGAVWLVVLAGIAYLLYRNGRRRAAAAATPTIPADTVRES